MEAYLYTHFSLPSWVLFLILTISCLRSSIAQTGNDQTCVAPLETLFNCLPYAQGKSSTPTPTCCNNLNQVFQTHPKCLCELIAASAHGGSSGIPPINQTLALKLPQACSIPADPRKCPGLLGISPSSPEAQIFEKGTPLAPSSSTSQASPSLSDLSNRATLSMATNVSFTVSLGSLMLTILLVC